MKISINPRSEQNKNKDLPFLEIYRNSSFLSGKLEYRILMMMMICPHNSGDTVVYPELIRTLLFNFRKKVQNTVNKTNPFPNFHCILEQ